MPCLGRILALWAALGMATPSARAVVLGGEQAAGGCLHRLRLYFDGVPGEMIQWQDPRGPEALAAAFENEARGQGLEARVSTPFFPAGLSTLGALPKDARPVDMKIFHGRGRLWILVPYGFRHRPGSGAILMKCREAGVTRAQATGFDPSGFPKAGPFVRVSDLVVRSSRGWPGLYRYRSPWSLRDTLGWLHSQLPSNGFTLLQEKPGPRGLVVWRLSKADRSGPLSAQPENGRDWESPGCTYSLVTDLKPNAWLPD